MIGSRGRLLVALAIANTKTKISSRETYVKAGKDCVFAIMHHCYNDVGIIISIFFF